MDEKAESGTVSVPLIENYRVARLGDANGGVIVASFWNLLNLLSSIVGGPHDCAVCRDA